MLYIHCWLLKCQKALQDGIHPVGNIGREQGSFWWPLLGAYLTHPLYFWDLNSVFSVFF
ncbi:uncharacterized protein LOC143242621 isoform X3 [Tachypleus tridentatus]|uniref:uncharacterized protein LOC143242621 isoform X3 n=1 Tax=Tachypleus tridentatus TaxID=6853 RepID=UPI003FD1F844